MASHLLTGLRYGSALTRARWFFGKDMEIYPAMFVIINMVLEPEISPKGALTSVVADRP